MKGPTTLNTSDAQLPPILAAYIDELGPGMPNILFCAVWLGVMIPLLAVLFYTSSMSLRRSAIFISNAIGISVGITLGILRITFQTNGILNPLKGLNRAEVLAYTILSSAVGPYVDCILFFRVIVVFPRRTTSNRVWLGIMIPLVALKVARLVNMVIFICRFASMTRGSQDSIPYYELALRQLMGETIEWTLQLVDNSICSLLFLWTLRHSIASEFTTMSGLSLKSMKAAYRQNALTSLFWIAAANFVFPCVFDVILLILFFKNDADGTRYLIVFISNVYIQIIGVLFATVWRATSQGLAPELKGKGTADFCPPNLAVQFARNQDISAGSGGTRAKQGEAV